jgi:hypothetical protein
MAFEMEETRVKFCACQHKPRGVCQNTEQNKRRFEKTEQIMEWGGIIIQDIIEYTFYCISYFNMCDSIKKIYIA